MRAEGGLDLRPEALSEDARIALRALAEEETLATERFVHLGFRGPDSLYV